METRPFGMALLVEPRGDAEAPGQLRTGFDRSARTGNGTGDGGGSAFASGRSTPVGDGSGDGGPSAF